MVLVWCCEDEGGERGRETYVPEREERAVEEEHHADQYNLHGG